MQKLRAWWFFHPAAWIARRILRPLCERFRRGCPVRCGGCRYFLRVWWRGEWMHRDIRGWRNYGYGLCVRRGKKRFRIHDQACRLGKAAKNEKWRSYIPCNEICGEDGQEDANGCHDGTDSSPVAGRLHWLI